ncbi:hypothetical protein B0H19DRAFT_914963, partial [Mycena capillaripes]
ISIIFTAGIRTNGRVEAENRITKGITGANKTLFQVFNALNTRTLEQHRDENIRVREHVGPFALQTCFNQMKLSPYYYDAKALQLPEGVRDWRPMNDFARPRAGARSSACSQISHTETGATHIIAILPDGRYLCDCCMGMNLGVVFRHYFVAWYKIPGLPFHLSLI